MEGLKLPKLVAFIFSCNALADNIRDIKETGQEIHVGQISSSLEKPLNQD